MKILIVHNYYRFHGGEERSIDILTNTLKAKGYTIEIFSADNSNINTAGYLMLLFTAISTPFSVKYYKLLRSKIKEFKPDVIHFHNVFPLLSPSVYWAAFKEKIPTIQTIHNYRFLCVNGLFLDNHMNNCEKCLSGNSIYAILGKCYRNSIAQTFIIALSLIIHKILGTFKKIDLYLCPTEFSKNKLIAGGFDKVKIVVVPHFLEQDQAVISAAKESYGIYIGRLSKEKGIKILLESACYLPEGWHIKIAGDGELQKEVVEKAGKSKKIEYLGKVAHEKIEELLRKAAFLIMPSECYENLPYAILEAYSCGVPVIATDLGALPENVLDNKTGFLVPPGNPEELGRAYNKLAGDSQLLDSMHKNSAALFNEKYSAETGYRQLISSYSLVLKDL